MLHFEFTFLKILRHKINNKSYAYVNRVIPKWNALPYEVASSTSVNQFKNLLDRHLDKQRTTNKEARKLGNIGV